MSNPVPNAKSHPKFKFSLNEDILLRGLVCEYGENNWSQIASQMPNRNQRQCRERWFNYLSPTVRNVPWTDQEDALLLQKVAEQGHQWHRLATLFPLRTDINIKNRYHVLNRKMSKTAPIESREVTNPPIRKTVVRDTRSSDLVNISPPTEPSPFSLASLLNA
jgi:hypothetical protein